MREKHARSAAWFATLLVFFPTWIFLEGVLSRALISVEANLSWSFPGWLRIGLSLLLMAGTLLGLSYSAAGFLERLYPRSASRSADWRDAGSHD